MFVVVTGFVIFRSDTLTDAGHVLSAMYIIRAENGSAATQFAQAFKLIRPSALPAIAVALIAMFPVRQSLTSRKSKLQTAGFILSIPLFILCVLNLATATYNPFIYYRF